MEEGEKPEGFCLTGKMRKELSLTFTSCKCHMAGASNYYFHPFGAKVCTYITGRTPTTTTNVGQFVRIVEVIPTPVAFLSAVLSP